MLFNQMSRLLLHFVGAALACAQIAYSAIRLMTPPPTPAPAPARASAVQDPDAALVARAFGQVERPVAAAIGNIQLAGVYAAGRDSAAVFIVGDRPAKAVRLGQEVAPGSTLVEVEPQSVTLDSGGVRRQLRVPNPPLVSPGGPAAPHGAAFEQHGDVLTAPTVDTPATTRPVTGRSPATAMPPRPGLRPEPVPAPPGRRDVVGNPTLE